MGALAERPDGVAVTAATAAMAPESHSANTAIAARLEVKAAVKATLAALVAAAPGRSVEVRVPP
ncbi:MAG: hypothetical protein F2838_10660, partial [Actinobacteria bacterium]|nr:hypothetical protein [Actinomycetota bacterium]